MKPAPLLVLLAITGCKLIDQNTFNPHAADGPVIPAPPVAAVAPPPLNPLPLLVITSPDPSAYTAQLKQAVASARSRKPDVVFDVVELQPPGTPADQPQVNEAQAVARVIVAQGVAAERVRLVARPEAGAAPNVVRVYIH